MTRSVRPRPTPPKTVSIGGHPWKVVLGGPEWHAAYAAMKDDDDHVARGEVLAGFCVRSLAMTIYLRPDMPLAVEQETLLHEIMHAGFYVIGQPIAWMDTRPQDSDDREMTVEEQIIQFTSPMMLRILRENPKVVEYLIA